MKRKRNKKNRHRKHKPRLSLFTRVKNSVMALVDKVMAIYHWLFEQALSIKAMHTYYDNSDDFIRRVSDRYLHLTDSQLQRAMEQSPVAVVGYKRIAKVATRRIRLRAMHVALVTFLCTLPQNWLLWVLMVVDMVNFQLQLFAITQELYILYKDKSEYADMKFDYRSLITVTVKMQGTLMKNKIANQAKKGVGKIGRWLVRQFAVVFNGAMQTFLRQAMKWLGVTASKEFIETSLTFIVDALCSFIAGLISYWLFVPMARRLERDLTSRNDVSTTKVE